MQDNFNINDWRTKMIRESLEEAEVPKETPKDNNFSQASDKLYKKVTGEEPKTSTKNKFRDVKEGEDIRQQLDNLLLDYDILDEEDRNDMIEDILKILNNG